MINKCVLEKKCIFVRVLNRTLKSIEIWTWSWVEKRASTLEKSACIVVLNARNRSVREARDWNYYRRSRYDCASVRAHHDRVFTLKSTRYNVYETHRRNALKLFINLSIIRPRVCDTVTTVTAAALQIWKKKNKKKIPQAVKSGRTSPMAAGVNIYYLAHCADWLFLCADRDNNDRVMRLCWSLRMNYTVISTPL